jgi:hypothetical protein
MKGLFNKVMVCIAGVVALFGISATNVRALVPDINSKTALYLEHGNSISSNVDAPIVQADHASHASHHSHHSHHSGS